MYMDQVIVEREIEAGHKMMVILVDEEKIVLRTLGDFLEDLEHEVMTFESVADLLDSAGQAERGDNRVADADLILIDIGEPRELRQEIIAKIHARFPGADILLMSDQRLTLPPDFAISNRVFGYMIKPVRLGELELYVARIKEGRNGRC
jgi:DNA-binding NtrC family response regulator